MAHEDERVVIYLNNGISMSRGKAASQAVHAALMLLDVHPGTAVVVLGGSKEQILECDQYVHDAGRTELPPGTLTAGARWARRPSGIVTRVTDDQARVEAGF